MTRFKELARIERAIGNKDLNELQWAHSYCEMRCEIGSGKNGRHWDKLLRKIKAALEEEKR